jgi:AP2-like factor (euAP2 lineage)
MDMALKSWVSISVSGKKVKIDREDLPRVSLQSWRVTKGTTGRERVITSIRGENGSRTVTLGAFLKKPPKGKQVYPRRFIEGLDYRKENLVVCTLKERQRLLPKKLTKTSSVYRGVSYQKSAECWRAAIEVEGEAINLGDFESEDHAADAYNRAARKYFGTMAYQNEIQKRKRRSRG